jgi:hypothetical protein
MKKTVLFISLLLLCSFVMYSFTENKTSKSANGLAERVSFKIKGTGSKNIFVTIGVGYQVGSGACCTGVSNNSTVGFVGEVGHVVYDGKTRKVITKIYKEMQGKTINLAEYY